MPIPPILPAGADVTAIASAVNMLRAERLAASVVQNLNGQNQAAGGIGDFRQLYVAGSLVSGYPRRTLPCSPVTGNAQANTFTAKDYVGDLQVSFDGVAQPLVNYSISRAVAPLAFADPGFESGLSMPPWVVNTTTGVTTVNPHVGTQCAFIGSANGAIFQTSSTGLVVGTPALITVDVRGDAGTTATAMVAIHDGTGSGAAQNSGPITLTTAWQTISLTFHPTSTGVMALGLTRSGTGNGNVYFDNVQFYAAAYFQNPDFETGNLASWGVTDYGITGVNPHSGNYCALLNQPGTISQTLTGLTPGTTPSITTWVRGDAGTTATASLLIDDGAGANQTPAPPITLTPVWQSVTWTYQVNSGGNLRLIQTRGTGAGAVYFDDAYILGGFVSQTFTVTFAATCQPRTGQAVTISGDILA